jgi:hypothetical protein
MRPYFQKIHWKKKMGAGGVAQSVGPEFKPQHYKKLEELYAQPPGQGTLDGENIMGGGREARQPRPCVAIAKLAPKAPMKDRNLDSSSNCAWSNQLRVGASHFAYLDLSFLICETGIMIPPVSWSIYGG